MNNNIVKLNKDSENQKMDILQERLRITINDYVKENDMGWGEVIGVLEYLKLNAYFSSRED